MPTYQLFSTLYKCGFITFQAVLEIGSLMEHGADILCTYCVGDMTINSVGRTRKFRRVDEFLVVMMRLWLGLIVKN